MKRMLTMFALAATVCLAATPAEAQKGTVRLSWTNCDPVLQNLNFTGPGQSEKLILSTVGSEDMHKGYRFKIKVGNGGTMPDAWRFDAAGCNNGQLSLSTALLNKACPAFQGTNPLPIFNYGYQVDGANTATFDILNAYDTADPAAATRYTLVQGTFDHLFSDSGPQDPAVACGNADAPMCFLLFYTEFLNPDLTSNEFGIENDWVTWNGNTSPGCPGVQNEATTWGRVKGLYR